MNTLLFQEFFVNLEEWSDKLQTLKDASNFLVEVVKEPIGLEIKNQVLMINQRFTDVKAEIGKFMQQQSLQQSQRTYQERVIRLQQWLDGTEGMLRSHPTCTLKDLKELMRQLDVCINVVPVLRSVCTEIGCERVMIRYH